MMLGGTLARRPRSPPALIDPSVSPTRSDYGPRPPPHPNPCRRSLPTVRTQSRYEPMTRGAENSQPIHLVDVFSTIVGAASQLGPAPVFKNEVSPGPDRARAWWGFETGDGRVSRRGRRAPLPSWTRPCARPKRSRRQGSVACPPGTRSPTPRSCDRIHGLCPVASHLSTGTNRLRLATYVEAPVRSHAPGFSDPPANNHGSGVSRHARNFETVSSCLFGMSFSGVRG